MSWINFIYWVTGLYALYYVANILWDLMRAKGGTATGHSQEWQLEEAPAPQKVSLEQKEKPAEPKKTKSDPAISAIGGVNLKDLFNLAKAEVIAYNRAVTF